MKKKKIIVMASTALTLALAGGVGISLSKASTAQTAWLVDGASVRYTTNSFGIRYTFQVTESAYDEDATYGILIAPEAYVTEGHALYKGALTIENVFGTGAVYGWAEKDENGDWKEYTGTKTQIVNLVTSEFNDKTVTINNESVSVKEFYGSMVPVREENIAVEFRAVGYIRTGEEGNYDYTLVGDDDNVRSMTYVAQLAIEDTSENAPSASQKKALQQAYIDSVTNIPSSYTQKYYLEQDDGTYVEMESLTSVNDTLVGSTVKTTIDDDVNMWIRDIDGYVFDADNANNKTSGKVYANDQLVLSAYYNKQVESIDLGLVDVSAQTSINVPVAGEYASYKKAVYKVVGATETAVNASWSDNVLAMDSTYNGVYKVKIENVNGTAVEAFTFDAYDSTADFEWNEIVASAGVATVGATDEDELLTDTRVAIASTVADGAESSADNYYEITSSTADCYNFAFSALHSKAYYEKYVNQGRTLSYEYYVSTTNADAKYVDVYQTGASADVWTKLPLNTWTQVTVSVDTLVANWDKGLLKVGAFYKQIADTVGAWTACDSTTVYVGNFAFLVDYSQIAPIDAGNVLQAVSTSEYNNYSLQDNLISKLSEEQQATFESYASLGDEVIWKTTTLSGENATGEATEVANGTLSFGTNAVLRTYKVEAYVSIDETEYLIYTGNIDFYNENDGIVWNDATQADLARVAHCKDTLNSTSVETTTHDTIGTSYKFSYSHSAVKQGVCYYVMPMHSKAYYEMFQAEYSDYMMTFDFNVASGSNRSVSYFLNPSDSHTDQVSSIAPATGTVYTMQPTLFESWWSEGEYTYTLDNFVAYYANLSNPSANPYNASTYLLSTVGNAAARNVYIGNIQFVKRTYTDATVTVEKNSLENGTYNVLDMFTSYTSEQTRLTELTNSGKLVWTAMLAGNTVDLNGTALENVELGEYTITAEDLLGNVICSGVLTVNRTVLTETGDTKLIDVSATTSFDLLDYVGEEYETALSGVNGLTWQLAKVNSDKTVLATGTTLTTADAEKVLYQVQALDSDGVLYTGINLDLYNPADGIVWNDMTDANLARMTYKSGYTSYGVETAMHETIGQSYYYYYTAGTNQTNVWFYVMPMHSKVYYEMFQAEYSDYIMTFDFLTTGSNNVYNYFLNGEDAWGSAGYEKIPTNKVLTMNPTFLYAYYGSFEKYVGYTYTLDNLVANYADLSSKTATGDSAGILLGVNNSKYRTIYIGNMQFVKRTYENTETTSVDVSTLTDNAYDLTTLFTAYATEQERLKALTTAGKLVWTVVDSKGGSVTVTGTSVTAVAGATYTVTAKDTAGNTICSGVVAFTETTA